MTRIPVLFLTRLTVIGAILSSTDGAETTPPAFPEGLEKEYQKISEGMRSEEVRKFMSAFELDFVFEGRDGSTVDRGPWRRVWMAKFEAVDYERVLFEVDSIVSKEADRIALRTRRVIVYRRADSGARELQESLLEDVWLKTDAGWQLGYQQELELRTEGSVSGGDDAEIASPRVAALAKTLDAAGKADLSAFWKEIAGKAPLVEPIAGDAEHRSVTFLFRDSTGAGSVALSGGLRSTGKPKALSRLGETDLWYRTERVPGDARFVYGFQVIRSVRLPAAAGSTTATIGVASTHGDPLNSTVFNGVPALEMSDAPPQRWILRVPDRPVGKLRRSRIQSAALGESRGVAVYTPAGYESLETPCKLVLLFDGEDYDRLIPTRTVLDNLIAEKKIPPTVAVLIDHQGSRQRDFGFSASFARFVSEELVQWVRNEYRVSDDPRDTVLGGVDLGGVMAAHCGLEHPKVFGNVLAQSAAFWRPHPSEKTDYAIQYGWLARQYAMKPAVGVRFYIEAGLFESERALEHNRRIRDILEAKGYPVTYREFAGSHDYLTSRDSLGIGLIALLGK